jgi:predicted DNA-binding transcriptional regulator YafY
MEGYKIPPVMFTEQEASALVTTEHLVLKNRDSSLIKEYLGAIAKVKAVLGRSTKEKMELLSNRIAVSPAIPTAIKSDSLSLIQHALTSFRVLEIVYQGEHDRQSTKRRIEPFAFYYSQQENWTLIAYCRLRRDYRMFRLDRMSHLQMLEATFKPHKLLLKDYLEEKEKNFKHP